MLLSLASQLLTLQFEHVSYTQQQRLKGLSRVAHAVIGRFFCLKRFAPQVPRGLIYVVVEYALLAVEITGAESYHRRRVILRFLR